MNSTNRVARLVGFLFIVGTVAGVLSGTFVAPFSTIQSDEPTYLTTVAANESQLLVGAFLVLVMGFSLALIPIVLYPVLKQYSETLAIGYVVFRGAVEFVTYLALAGIWLLIVAVSRAGSPADASSPSQSVGVLLGGYDVVYSILLTLVFASGALVLYYALYQSRLVPHWLSGWGLVAAVWWFTWGLVVLLGLSNVGATVQLGVSVPVETLFALPIALQEMVMAVWLLVKGFDESSMTAVPSTDAAPHTP